MQNLQFLAQLCPKYHIKPEDSDQNFEYILRKNCNSSSAGRHAKLSERKFDFNILDIDVIIIHWTPSPVFRSGFGQKWRFTFSKILLLLPTSLKGLGYRKWKQTSKRKRYLSALEGASPSLKNWGSPFLYSPEKLKAASFVLISTLPRNPFLKKCHMF